jgi:hypothetical protein
MCEAQTVRYVHEMQHPDYPEVLKVGCICAGHMESDYAAARLREQQLKNRSSRRAKWLSRKWRTSAKGNDYLNTDGFNVVIHRYGQQWASRVTHKETGVHVNPGNLSHITPEAAKLAALNAMLDVSHEYFTGFDIVVFRSSSGRWTAMRRPRPLRSSRYRHLIRMGLALVNPLCHRLSKRQSAARDLIGFLIRQIADLILGQHTFSHDGNPRFPAGDHSASALERSSMVNAGAVTRVTKLLNDQARTPHFCHQWGG